MARICHGRLHSLRETRRLEKEPVEEARDEIDVTEETVDARLRLDVASVALPVEDVLE